MERVYLNDWLYNAGIVGFLRIMTSNGSVKDQLIKIGENYIEFDRGILNGFSKKYFDFTFNRYGRYDRVIKSLTQYLEDLKNADDTPQNILEKVNNILRNFEKLKENIEIPSKGEITKYPEKLEDVLEAMINDMKINYKDYWESDVQIYLRRFYGQKSFLGRTVKTDRFEKFLTDFEEKILNDEIEYDKTYKCIVCGDRRAKKDTMFDTGISPFYGLNKDSSNFSWNFNPKLPICEICEIVYLCYFAGLTPFTQGNKSTYYFVNRDTSVEDLYKANNLLQELLNSDIKDNFLIEFFTQLILETERIKAEYTLQNIAVIELDIENPVFPKVYSFNISKEKARYIKDNHNELKGISKSLYRIKNETKFLISEIIEMIVNNNLNYTYLNNLLRIYLTSEKSELYEIFFNLYTLQELNKLIYRFQKMSYRRDIMREEELWQIFYKGKELSKKLKDAKAENKISSIAYKLLNALKVGDINQFMDTIIRTYMTYEMEIPSIFTKAINDKEIFYPMGYSFLNGLLEKWKEEKQNG